LFLFRKIKVEPLIPKHFTELHSQQRNKFKQMEQSGIHQYQKTIFTHW
jgi:hypothetical protein